VKVNVLLAVRVLPLAIVRVPVLELIVKPLILVARAAPRVGVTRVGLDDRTTEPVPVTAVMPVPLIWNTLPVAAVLNVLLVKVSVVALPTRVSVATGNVNTLEPAVAPDKI